MSQPFRCDDHDRDFKSLNALANHVQNSGDHGPDDWQDALARARDMADTPDDDEPDDEDDDPVMGDREPPTCPKCGGTRWFDASEHTDYQYGCADCSTAETWEVWGDE